MDFLSQSCRITTFIFSFLSLLLRGLTARNSQLSHQHGNNKTKNGKSRVKIEVFIDVEIFFIHSRLTIFHCDFYCTSLVP